VTRVQAAILVLSILGAAIAAYLTYVHYAHVAPICTTGGCEQVQRSSYATVAGVPVALLGLLAYCGIAATALRRGLTAAVVGVVLALAGAAFSGYLLWAQLGPIGAICQWCLGNDAVIGGIALLSVARLLTEPD
jgi:uncharacterized membrane protein